MRTSSHGRSTVWILAGALLCAVTGSPARAVAQSAAPAEEARPGEQVFLVSSPENRISMTHLATRIIELPSRIRFVDGFNPDVLEASALSPHRVRLRATNPGVTTVTLLDEFDKSFHVEVFVEPDTRELQAYLKRLFPASSIEVVGLRDGVVLRGWVTEPTHIPQMIQVAEEFYGTVHNQLQVGGVMQVQLHVKVMEVQRSKLRELGFNFALLGQQYYYANTIGALAPIAEASLPFGGPPSIAIQQAALATPEMQFAVTGNSDIFQGFIKALQTEALAKILAEPILVTTSGRPATMLSGGEFPVLVPQSLGTVSIQWREFGVRMEAVPIVLGQGRLRLDIAPEVSERDFSNSVSVNGLVVPGITVRRVNTQVEMRFGETLMIGGLISTRRTGSTQKIPFLGELPWIGAAFSRKTYEIGETELLILVTPHMAAPVPNHQVPAGGPGLATDIPTDHELYVDGMLEVPKFGPDCVDCGEQTIEIIQPPGLIRPVPETPGASTGVPLAPAASGDLIVPPATSAAPAPPSNVQQMSGVREDRQRNVSTAVGRNPFHNEETMAPNTAAETDQLSPAPKQNATGNPMGARLPGLIRPFDQETPSETSSSVRLPDTAADRASQNGGAVK